MELYGVFFTILLVLTACSESAEFRPRLQPELDSINLDNYLKNERNLKLQFKCLLDDSAPCDIVGKWLKPRVAKGLLGDCILCTPKQVGYIHTVTAFVQDKYPQVFRALLTKYVTELGIQVPQDLGDNANLLKDIVSNSNRGTDVKKETAQLERTSAITEIKQGAEGSHVEGSMDFETETTTTTNTA